VGRESEKESKEGKLALQPSVISKNPLPYSISCI
jgi:hypothetical protein